MNTRTVIALLFSLLAAHASELKDERIWTGVNGKSFRGVFLQLTDDETGAQIASNTGKIFTISLDNLSEPDRLLILESRPAPEEPAKGETPNDAPGEGGGLPGFKNPPAMPRSTLMPTTPEAIGARKSDELVDPFWQFLGWWDTEKVLPIPRDGDFDERLEWAHERLARHCKIRTGGSVIDVEKLREGLEKYFEENLNDQAAIVVREDTDFNPARLSQYATGMNAVVLRLSMIYNTGRRYRACAAVESIEPNGNAILHLWGCRKAARIVIDKRRPPKHGWSSLSSAMDSYKVILADLDDLPDFVIENEPTFFVDPEQYDTVVIAKPYLFAKEGVRRQPPADDPLFTPKRGLQAPAEVRKAVGRIDLPIDFLASFNEVRPWAFNDGSLFEGKLNFDRKDEPSLRDNSGKTRALDVATLTHEHQAAYYFARGCSGSAAKPPRLELHYQLESQHGDTYDFKITTEGSLGRIDCEKASSSLIFDLEDHAYSTKRSSRGYYGRWKPDGLVPQGSRTTWKESDKHEQFSSIVRSARPSPNFDFPARFASFPLTGSSFLEPKVEFTLVEAPTAMVAIYQILNASSPAIRDQDNPKAPDRQSIIVFSLATEVSNHNGLRQIAPRFIDHYMLPLRLRWTNPRNTSWVSEEDRTKASGQFSFTLRAARVPPSFPDDHFLIPDAARKAELGTCIRAAK